MGTVERVAAQGYDQRRGHEQRAQRRAVQRIGAERGQPRRQFEHGYGDALEGAVSDRFQRSGQPYRRNTRAAVQRIVADCRQPVVPPDAPKHRKPLQGARGELLRVGQRNFGEPRGEVRLHARIILVDENHVARG